MVELTFSCKLPQTLLFILQSINPLTLLALSLAPFARTTRLAMSAKMLTTSNARPFLKKAMTK